jgi:hypothetical protein
MSRLLKPFYQYGFEIAAARFLSERDGGEYNPDHVNADLVRRLDYAEADNACLTSEQAVRVVIDFEAEGRNAYSDLSPLCTLHQGEVDFFEEYERQLKD